MIHCYFCNQPTEMVMNYSSVVCRNCNPQVIHQIGSAGEVNMVTLLENGYYYDYIISRSQIRIYEVGGGKLATIDQKINNSQELKSIGDRLINLKVYL